MKGFKGLKSEEARILDPELRAGGAQHCFQAMQKIYAPLGPQESRWLSRVLAPPPPPVLLLFLQPKPYNPKPKTQNHPKHFFFYVFPWPLLQGPSRPPMPKGWGHGLGSPALSLRCWSLGSPVVPFSLFLVSRFPYEVTIPKKGALIVRWLLGYQGLKSTGSCQVVGLAPWMQLRWLVRQAEGDNSISTIFARLLVFLGQGSVPQRRSGAYHATTKVEISKPHVGATNMHAPPVDIANSHPCTNVFSGELRYLLRKPAVSTWDDALATVRATER